MSKPLHHSTLCRYTHCTVPNIPYVCATGFRNENLTSRGLWDEGVNVGKGDMCVCVCVSVCVCVGHGA